MTLLSRKLCTLLGSPRSPCWCRVRPLLLPRPLLTVEVTLLLFLGLSSLHNRPLLRPPLPGGGRLRTVRVRLPFRKPPATPVASKRGPGSGQHDVPAAPLRVGACLALHWRWWQAIGVESWDGYRVPFLDSLPPLARSPVSFPTYWAGSPRVSCAPLGDQGDVGQRRIGDRSRSRTRLLQSLFSGGKGDGRLVSL